MIPALLGNGIGCRGIPVPAECREFSLNLGGNTDKIIRPEHTLLRVFFLKEVLKKRRQEN